MDFSQFELKRQESEARMEFVRTLAKGSHIHLSGICGTGMGSVAALLKQLGFRISGSDKAFYPPMGGVVKALTSEIYEGYRPENLTTTPALVVIGNNLSADNPEVKEVIARGIPFASMPEVIGALLIGTREQVPTSIVVTGTHGKTTTTAAIATLLDKAGRSPGFMIGGVPLDLPSQVRPGVREVVIEGDEYDSAFFAKWPKFLSYRPDILVITSLEFDHADIYENIEEIEREFTRLISLVPSSGKIFVSTDSPALLKLIPIWREQAKAELISYGTEGQLEVVRRIPQRFRTADRF
jgi:UDP-N-acetylmuramate: L-alanyl-gamma-D-glutamyl-meso-diaminopimelate ligase